ncbi:MAG: alcohol dehydrogenase catalytic domain-containing protein [Caulobacterales bacterium]
MAETPMMRAVQVSVRSGPLELVRRPIPQPSSGEVRVKVSACGVCHSDNSAISGHFPGQIYPIIPGHEIIGAIDAVGPNVTGWAIGERVGAGWFAGYCGTCDRCKRGDFMTCLNREIHGVTRDGGYAEYVICSANALARVPDDLSDIAAAPMLCAGVTVYNALARSCAPPGGRVAILGIGGLGHLAVQFAVKFGYHVVAIARGATKAEKSAQLGAHRYIDSTTEDVAGVLKSLGGVHAIIATVTDAPSISRVIDGLTIDGRLVVVGVPGAPIEIYAHQILYGRTITGSAGGTAIESEDAMKCAARSGVSPIVETFSIDDASQAFARTMEGRANLRVVLTP